MCDTKIKARKCETPVLSATSSSFGAAVEQSSTSIYFMIQPIKGKKK